MGSGVVSQVVRPVRARAGTAEPQLRGRGDDDRSLVFWLRRAHDRYWHDRQPVAQQSDDPRSDGFILVVSQMVHRESRVQRAAARAQFLRPVVGLPRLDHSWGHLRLHHHRLGLGLRGLDAMGLPKYSGHAARSRIRRQRHGVSVARDRGRFRQHLYHPDTMGVSLDLTVAGVADSFGRAKRDANAKRHLRCPASLPGRPMRPACRRA